MTDTPPNTDVLAARAREAAATILRRVAERGGDESVKAVILAGNEQWIDVSWGEAIDAMIEFATAPNVASDTMREAGEQFAENAKNLPGIDPATLARAKAHVAAIAIVNADPIAAFAALSVQPPAAGQDGEGLERAAQVADQWTIGPDDRVAEAARDIAAAIRALNPTKDAQS